MNVSSARSTAPSGSSTKSTASGKSSTKSTTSSKRGTSKKGAFCAKGSRAKYKSGSKKSTGKPTAQSWAKAPKNDYVQSMVKRYAPALANKQHHAEPQAAAVNRVGQVANKEPASRAQYMAD